FEENLQYFGTRLSKLQVDTRAVARCLELFQLSCDPYLSGLFPEREAEAKTLESNALLSLLDAELAADDLSVLLQKVMEITTRTFQASMGAILLRETESNNLRLANAVGLDEVLPDDFKVVVGQGFAGNIASSGEPAMVLDTSGESSFSANLRAKAKSL